MIKYVELICEFLTFYIQLMVDFRISHKEINTRCVCHVWENENKYFSKANNN